MQSTSFQSQDFQRRAPARGWQKTQTFFMEHPPKNSQNIPQRVSKNLSSKHRKSSRFISTYQTARCKAPRDCPTHRGKEGIQVFTVDIFCRKAMALESLALPKGANVIICHQGMTCRMMPSIEQHAKQIQTANIAMISP